MKQLTEHDIEMVNGAGFIESLFISNSVRVI